MVSDGCMRLPLSSTNFHLNRLNLSDLTEFSVRRFHFQSDCASLFERYELRRCFVEAADRFERQPDKGGRYQQRGPHPPGATRKARLFRYPAATLSGRFSNFGRFSFYVNEYVRV